MSATTTITVTPAPAVTGSALVAAVEAFWSSLVERHPELPSKIVVVTGKGDHIRGHWAIDRWTDADAERLPELFIAGERMADGGLGVATTVIHEAAHALLQARGDLSGGTSRQGRYHTRKGFATAAEELGLVAPAAADPALGFSDCTMSEATDAAYATEIAELADALGASIPQVDEAALARVVVTRPRKPRTYRKAVVLACECRTIKVPAKLAEDLADTSCRRCGIDLLDAAEAEEEEERYWSAVAAEALKEAEEEDRRKAGR